MKSQELLLLFNELQKKKINQNQISIGIAVKKLGNKKIEMYLNKCWTKVPYF